MPRIFRVVGLCLCAAAAPLVLRLIWEMTALTWQRGPQMVGFTLLHVYPVPALIGALCWIAVAVWLISALTFRAIRRMSLSGLDCVVVCSAVLLVFVPLIPYRVWRTGTEFFLGTSPAASDMFAQAASEGDSSEVRRLLGRGISVDSSDRRGCTALARATSGKHPEMVAVLLSHGADLTRYCDGQTPLHIAAANGDLATTKLLLDAGANRSVRSANGFTAADLAWAADQKAIADLLESRSTK